MRGRRDPLARGGMVFRRAVAIAGAHRRQPAGDGLVAGIALACAAAGPAVGVLAVAAARRAGRRWRCCCGCRCCARRAICRGRGGRDWWSSTWGRAVGIGAHRATARCTTRGRRRRTVSMPARARWCRPCMRWAWAAWMPRCSAMATTTMPAAGPRWPEFPIAALLAPAGSPAPGIANCVAGQSWEWDGVRFRMLHPTPGFPTWATKPVACCASKPPAASRC